MEKKELESKIFNSQKELNQLIEEKELAQASLATLKGRLRVGGLEKHQLDQINKAKITFNVDLNRISKKHRDLKLNLSIWKKELNDITSSETIFDSTGVKKDLQELKDKYFEFYKDKTRIASMRNMAKDFIIEIDYVIKKQN
tara:strand:- start:733 stop:1158 length:426 start_codon:yes stop_codon:yes gene_type:complete